MNSLRKKVGIQFLASNGALAASFVLSIIIARLLTPEEIGIFSMSAVLVAFSHVFRDFGVNSFIKRQKHLDAQTIRTATGVLYVTSFSMAGLLYLSSWLWAAFFNVEGVRHVVQVLALGFLFIPFGAIPNAILSRNMDVEKNAKVLIFGTAVYCAASIALALAGFGYMTMAWANLINILAMGIGYNFVKPHGMPRRPSLKGWREIVNFGGGSVLTSSLKAIDNALPDVMLGRMATPSHVGFFSRANSTVGIITSALTPTINALALPYLSKTFHSKARLDEEFCRGTSYLASVVWPALAFVFVMKNEIVFMLYGNVWMNSVPAIGWLCVAVAIQSAFTLVSTALTGMGKPYIVGLPIATTLTIKAVSAWWLFDGSLESFAASLLLGDLASIPIYLAILKNRLGISLRRWLDMQAGPVMLAMMLCLIMWGLRVALAPHIPGWALLGATGVVALATWLCAVAQLRLPIWNEVEPFLRKWSKR